MNSVFIALGSNIEPRHEYLKDAIHMLSEDPNIYLEAESSIYETEPVGYTEQHSFLNMVVQIKTTLKPLDLLKVCQHIESTLGRKRIIRWGPRTVDLDILLYNQESVNIAELTIPHPRMKERAFVLIPLRELSEEIIIDHHSVLFYLERLTEEECKGVKKWHRKDGA